MSLRLKNGFLKMSDPQLEIRANQILSAMTGNANFAAPDPTVAVMKTIVTAYTTALTNCKSGDRFKIAEKNQKRATLVQNLHLWSYYVLLESNGNEAIAITSGFSIAQASSPRPPLQKPKALEITNGINNGELLVAGKRVAGASSYFFEYATLEGMTTNNWNSIPSTRTRHLITDLSRGTLYYCRMAAVGNNNQLVYSDVTSRTAA